MLRPGQHIDFSGQNAVGVQTLAQGGIGLDDLPLLDYFDLSFEDDDHHIRSIMALPPIESAGDRSDGRDQPYAGHNLHMPG